MMNDASVNEDEVEADLAIANDDDDDDDNDENDDEDGVEADLANDHKWLWLRFRLGLWSPGKVDYHYH